MLYAIFIVAFSAAPAFFLTFAENKIFASLSNAIFALSSDQSDMNLSLITIPCNACSTFASTVVFAESVAIFPEALADTFASLISRFPSVG